MITLVMAFLSSQMFMFVTFLTPFSNTIRGVKAVTENPWMLIVTLIAIFYLLAISYKFGNK